MKKILLAGFSLLAVGLLILSSQTNVVGYQTVKASSSNDFVEVMSETCGMKSDSHAKVKLTTQQYHDLERYLCEFSNRLNQTTTREEATGVFKEAVVKLNEFGLLPKGMNIAQAQRLVIGPDYNFAKKQMKEPLTSPKYCNNSFCLIAGKGYGTGFLPYIFILSYPLYMIGSFLGFLGYYSHNHLTTFLGDLLVGFYIFLSELFDRKIEPMFCSDVYYWHGYSSGWIRYFW